MVQKLIEIADKKYGLWKNVCNIGNTGTNFPITVNQLHHTIYVGKRYY